MPARVLVVAFMAAMLSGAAAQEAVQDGPKARFNDDLITKLEGRWLVTRQIRGTEVHNLATAAWVLNHQFLQLHMKDTAEPPAYEAIVLIGFVHASQDYVAIWTDTFGGRFAAMGRGRRSGNSIEFRFEYPDGPFFNTFTSQPEQPGWTFRMEAQSPTGDRLPFATDSLARIR
ncbi:MAG TPA: hypothetical protein VMK32_03715 [Burkholderiaceae bacterium]|nr:hypothetical protein [Burkholderiaceae bacterium]